MFKYGLHLVFVLSFSQLGIPQAQATEGMKSAGYTNIQKFSPNFYEHSKVAFTHKTSLDVFVLGQTGWDRRRVIERYQEVADILAQCGVEIKPLRIVEATPPSQFQGDLFQSNDLNQRSFRYHNAPD